MKREEAVSSSTFCEMDCEWNKGSILVQWNPLYIKNTGGVQIVSKEAINTSKETLKMIFSKPRKLPKNLETIYVLMHLSF